MGVWGWSQSDNWLRFVLMLAIPLLAAAIWGIFAVPGDPSRSGNAPVPVPGIVRLILEFAFFAFATRALFQMGYSTVSWTFGIIVILHYVISYDRILFVIRK